MRELITIEDKIKEMAYNMNIALTNEEISEVIDFISCDSESYDSEEDAIREAIFCVIPE